MSNRTCKKNLQRELHSLSMAVHCMQDEMERLRSENERVRNDNERTGNPRVKAIGSCTWQSLECPEPRRVCRRSSTESIDAADLSPVSRILTQDVEEYTPFNRLSAIEDHYRALERTGAQGTASADGTLAEADRYLAARTITQEYRRSAVIEAHYRELEQGPSGSYEPCGLDRSGRLGPQPERASGPTLLASGSLWQGSPPWARRRSKDATGAFAPSASAPKSIVYEYSLSPHSRPEQCRDFGVLSRDASSTLPSSSSRGPS